MLHPRSGFLEKGVIPAEVVACGAFGHLMRRGLVPGILATTHSDDATSISFNSLLDTYIMGQAQILLSRSHRGGPMTGQWGPRERESSRPGRTGKYPSQYGFRCSCNI